MPAKTDAKRIDGAELRHARKSHRELSRIEDLASATGIGYSTIQRAEKGNGTFETVELIALHLGRNPWDFWHPLDPLASPPAGAHEATPDSRQPGPLTAEEARRQHEEVMEELGRIRRKLR